MIKVNQISELHIELTDKCQAQCPMCARNFHGGPLRPFIKGADISLAQFKDWFPKKFLSQLENFYSCGNYGDPAFAADCLEIYSYVRSCNETTRLALHTNGGMRNKDWWRSLATAIGTKSNSEVIFAIDGFKRKHELYRRNTNFDKVIENMCAFIDAGGKARVDSLVFEHNELDVNDLESYLLGLGVSSINFVRTTRFYNMEKFAVVDKNGNFEYDLKPASDLQYKMTPQTDIENFLDNHIMEKEIDKAVIKPKCTTEKSIYIDPHGNIFPCCWTGGEYQENLLKEKLPIHALRNIVIENTKEVFRKVGVPNCNDKVFEQDIELFSLLPEFWKGKNKCLTCARQCSNLLFDKNKYA